MMQDLDADFRVKETEIMQHTNKVPVADNIELKSLYYQRILQYSLINYLITHS